MKSSREIEEICREYDIENYTINEDGSIDVDGDVYLSYEKLTELPLNFNYVSRYFECDNNELTTLKGSPKQVGGSFICNYNNLTTLEYGPEEVFGYYDCNHNKLTSLKGSPNMIGDWFDCKFNEIVDLYGLPDEIGGRLYLRDNPVYSMIEESMEMDFYKCFNSFRVIKDGRVQLKRLKYLMDTFNKKYDLKEIKKYYKIDE